MPYQPLATYVKLRVVHAPGMLGTFFPPLRVSDSDMHHGTCVTHVPWCMPGSLTSGSLWSRCIHNPQLCVSGKRPIGWEYHKRTVWCFNRNGWCRAEMVLLIYFRCHANKLWFNHIKFINVSSYWISGTCHGENCSLSLNVMKLQFNILWL